MEIKRIICQPHMVNCYVLYEKGGTESIVIDPESAEPVLQFLKQENLSCRYILLTHGHYDHITGLAEVKKATGAQVCIHEDDADMLVDSRKNLSIMAGEYVEPCPADILLHDNDLIKMGNIELKVIHTPGHTKGGVCFLAAKEYAIFTGDTIFRLNVGRVDFPHSSNQMLYDSITKKLFTLPGGDYALYPGHMALSTLETEKKHNRFIRTWQ